MNTIIFNVVWKRRQTINCIFKYQNTYKYFTTDTPEREFLCFVRNLVNKAKKINRLFEEHLGQAQS